jgi:hypothetical protein
MLLLLLETANLKPAVGWQLGLAFSAAPTYRCVLRSAEWHYRNAVFPATTATVALCLSCRAAPSPLLRRGILPRRIYALPEFARLCRG